MIFSRKRPRLCLVAGLILCGLKWPFNWIIDRLALLTGWNIPGANVERARAMKDTKFGTLAQVPGLVDAFDRIEKLSPDNDGEHGRLSHNLTNLAIEWTRAWTPYATKFIAGLFVWTVIALIVKQITYIII